jgi:cytochrome P450
MAAGSHNGVMTQGAAPLSTDAPPPLFSAGFQLNPYPTYRRCLEGPTLQPMEGRAGVWLLFGYEACAKLLRDARLSSVRPGSAMVVVPPEELGEFDDLVRHMQQWLLLRDAPRHTELRRLMNRGFTPAMIERSRPAVEAILERLLDEASRSGSIDLIRDVAYPFPVRVICELLGLPRETHERCVTLSDDIAGWFGNLRRPPDLARVAQTAIRELETLFSQTIRDRRGQRGDDLLSLLVDAAESSQLMSHEELLAQCVMLLFGGHETTRNLIGNGLYSLLAHPEVCDQLRGDETLLPAAVEELLRYESPVQAFGRVVTADLEFEGVTVPAGGLITFFLGAAHRDPRRFADPHRRELARPHNRHLAFGGDAHVCLGSTLARLQGRLGIGGVLRRFPNLRLKDESPDWGPNFALRGLKSLRVDT